MFDAAHFHSKILFQQWLLSGGPVDYRCSANRIVFWWPYLL